MVEYNWYYIYSYTTCMYVYLHSYLCLQFYPFGSAHNDSLIRNVDDGSSSVNLSGNYTFFNQKAKIIYVSKLLYVCFRYVCTYVSWPISSD